MTLPRLRQDEASDTRPATMQPSYFTVTKALITACEVEETQANHNSLQTI